MGKIIFEKVDFHYPEIYTPVFEKVSICIDTQWRLGLIGRNGRGKTTLLRLMGGELSPTAGRIKKDVAVEYFPYNYLGDAEETLDVIKECIGGLYSLEQHLDDADSLEAYMELDGFGMEGKIRKEAGKIGLRDCVLERKFDTLSSGERTKALIIAMFLRQNTFVLLDEPTNHLDAYGKEELKNYLRRKRGFILVSHDRAFLDCVADHILSVNKADITVEKEIIPHGKTIKGWSRNMRGGQARICSGKSPGWRAVSHRKETGRRFRTHRNIILPPTAGRTGFRLISHRPKEAS